MIEMNTNTPNADIKIDLVNEMELSQSHLEWFNALYSSIKSELATGNKHQATRLAEIGQYLTEDFAYYNDLNLKEVLKQTKH